MAQPTDYAFDAAKPWSVPEMAAWLDVSVDYIYTAVEAGTMPCTRLPNAAGKTGRRREIRFWPEDRAQLRAEGEQPAINANVIRMPRRRSA